MSLGAIQYGPVPPVYSSGLSDKQLGGWAGRRLWGRIDRGSQLFIVWSSLCVPPEGRGAIGLPRKSLNIRADG